MTDATPEEGTPTTYLNPEQLARAESLGLGRALLTGEEIPVGIVAMFGGSAKPVSLGTNYVSDIMMLSEYVLGGIGEAEVEEVSGPQFGGIIIDGGPMPESLAAAVAGIFGRIRRHATEEAEAEGETEAGEKLDGFADGTEPGREDDVDGRDIPLAVEGDLIRHAEKQGVSYSDAWSYFESRGYDMTDLGHLEFDSTVPGETKNEGDLL